VSRKSRRKALDLGEKQATVNALPHSDGAVMNTIYKLFLRVLRDLRAFFLRRLYLRERVDSSN
jgi:hypothetical protein